MKKLSKKEKRELKKKDKGIVDFAMVTNHFFKKLPNWIHEMKDPRHKSYVKYEQMDLITMGILKNVCGIESMRQMEEKFNEETCIETLKILTGNNELDEMPHYDTLNYYLEKLAPVCLETVKKKMIKALIKGKQFYKNRLLGKHWQVILDGTGLFYFKERHCKNCLSTTRTDEDGNETKGYYHKVVEAKLILSKKIVISLGTEFIENEKEDVAKQDCEINAAKRLITKIKKDYPRLNICLQGDALYANEPLMKICRENNWMYIFTHKENRQKIIAENYNFLEENKEKRVIKKIGKEKGNGKYGNKIHEYAGKIEVMNVYEYNYSKVEKGEEKSLRFQWISNIEITDRNLEEMINGARKRWKIENEGFNNQKNGIYKIEHLNSRSSNGMKNHYLLTQVADIIMQLYLVWQPLIKEIKQSIKNTSSRLLESFRRQTVTDEDVSYITRYTTVYLE